MAYTALYRTFRPTKFSDMVGQDHITRTLKNQIMAGRVGHAYLFCGSRGTGKTTSAKILARAVNCLNLQDGEPCNECEICREILSGSLTDVIEMDAASNNGVDDIREIRDAVNFLPTKAKYRVYIIDEVHMLSTGAFNALLKTLEEPPEHVKFILATTEPQKLPATILSRCQRFDYKKISEENVIKRLKIICEESYIKISDEALKIIAILSEGAMRDAISILERCSQETQEEISSDLVKELVGIPSVKYIARLVKSMFERDEIEALKSIDDVINDGKDLYNFLWEVIKYLKDILVYKATNNLEIYSAEEIEEIKALSELAQKDRILKIIYDLSELENTIKWSAQRTIMFQTGVIKICSDFVENTSSSSNSSITDSAVKELLNKIAKLEQKVERINPSELMKKAQNVYESNDEPKAVKEETEFTKPKEATKTTISSNDLLRKILNSLKQNKKMMLYTILINARAVMTDDMNIEFEFPNGLTPFNEKVMNDPNNKNDLLKAIFGITGKEMHIKIKDTKLKEPEKKANDNPLADLGIDVKIIE